MKFLISILFPLLSFGQIDIRLLGASASNADNYLPIQKAIDSAVKTGQSVYIPVGRFRVSRPLMVYKYSTKYDQVFIKIIGESTFWDTEERSVLVAEFGDAPLLSIQQGKGCIIDGVSFVGRWKAPGSPYGKLITEYIDSNTRDSRFSPYAGIAIDPVSFRLPSDGGYPPLVSMYRGTPIRSGSTGVIVRNCSFNGFTVGVITSPNGVTQNAELLTFENIRIRNCKIGIVGCQAQEKLNRIINVGAWGVTHTVFAFSYYGEATGGNWVIDGVNVAGQVNQVIFRTSLGWFPLFMSNVFAESIFQFGYWLTNVGDALTNFSINFVQLSELPAYHFEGGGVLFQNGNIRYFGKADPISFLGYKKNEDGAFRFINVKSNEYLNKPSVFIEGFKHALPDGVSDADCFNAYIVNGQIENNTKPGKYALFFSGDRTYLGYAIMDGTKIMSKSASIKDGKYKMVVK